MNAAQRVHEAWGQSAPEWMQALARACDAHTLRKVAAMLKVSPALVSLNLRRQSNASELLEKRVKSRIMVSLIHCPVLGLIDAPTCMTEQEQPLLTTNTQRIQLYKACHGGCLHFKGEE